jgi:membrane-associated protease RseP (regulator of RpoE activity)
MPVLRFLLGLTVLLSLLAIGWKIFSTRRASQSQPSGLQLTANELLADPVRFITNRFTGGIGAAIMMDSTSGMPAIGSVIAGSPAEAAGLKSKDILLEIGNELTKGKTLKQVVEMIRGLTIANVNILVQRDGTNLNCVVSRTSWKTIRQLGNIQEVLPTTPIPRPVLPVQQQPDWLLIPTNQPLVPMDF